MVSCYPEKCSHFLNAGNKRQPQMEKARPMKTLERKQPLTHSLKFARGLCRRSCFIGEGIRPKNGNSKCTWQKQPTNGDQNKNEQQQKCQTQKKHTHTHTKTKKRAKRKNKTRSARPGNLSEASAAKELPALVQLVMVECSAAGTEVPWTDARGRL